MFSVDEATASAIRRVFHEEGELSAMIELRRVFPAITDSAKARDCVRTIAGWKPAAEAGEEVVVPMTGVRRRRS